MLMPQAQHHQGHMGDMSGMNGMKSPMPSLQHTNSAGIPGDMQLKPSMMDMQYKGSEGFSMQSPWMSNATG